jgi:hypothetical protein
MSNSKERPILFSGQMVRDILDGRKTQTRRLIKPQPSWVAEPSVPFKTPDADPKGIIKCPYGIPKDKLWVRETWGCCDEEGFVPYSIPKKQGTLCVFYDADNSTDGSWFPSIHMPRWASRILLEVSDVRVERLQDITPYGAIQEGFGPYANSFTIDCDTLNPRDVFLEYWDSINAKRGFGWDDNPWVWVIEFRRVEDE